MKSKLLVLLVFFKIILALAIVSADVLTPGFHPIEVNNYISNIEDFPDHVFVSAGGIGTGMCPLKIISDSGDIDGYYKFCGIFVYAIAEKNFNETKIEEMNLQDMSEEEIRAYFNSIEAKEVISFVDTYDEVPVISSVKEKKNYYEISLTQVKEDPDKTVKIRNNLIYVYIAVPVIALFIIVLIIVKRKKK